MGKNKIVLGAVIFSFLASPALPCEILKGKVVGVRDGDTIEILVKKKEVPIRLAGIDAPEKGQAFGQKAKEFTADKVFGKTVRVFVTGQHRDRKIGEVSIDGEDLSELLVAAGLAWREPRFSKSLGLEALESQARATKRGLWADKAPVAPWEFRHQAKFSP